ncbi:FeoB-associated Cys-rich membrane protein [Tropicimonas aquimaris]|uniref:FeoB-associated Cys-rich membrane protein n=1 Tax=Tropicimonas aquimaris TaxID=914152 RepID=A0ABW3ISC1_9RHOB
MNGDMIQPMVDLGREAGIAPTEYALVALLAGLALAYLLRGVLRRKARGASRGGCTGCAGCPSSGGCPSASRRLFDIDDIPDAKVEPRSNAA